jgi:hypothetical protein
MPLLARETSKWLDWLIAVVAATTFILLSWRSTLSCNRHRELDTFAKAGPNHAYHLRYIAEIYDDGVTQTTARNFVRDGFLHTHFLANRGGFPLASLYDDNTQCDSLAPPKNLIRYDFGNGHVVDMKSLNNDCVYSHFPPLADWVFGILAILGFNQYGDYRVFAVGLNCSFLVVLYYWLRREVSQCAAAVAVLLTATLPAFIHWSDALFFHPFQFLFLFAALLSLSKYLEQGRSRWFWCTWLLFFAQSLLTYQLLPCFAAMMVGLIVADETKTWSFRWKLLLRLFSAPVVATLLHFSMRLSHMGLAYTWDNVVRTLHNRAVGGASYLQFLRLLIRIREYLLRFDLLVLCLLLVIIVRVLYRHPVKRPLLLLLSFFLGGIGFWVAFPTTNLLHYWMTYRHVMPLVIYLLALTAESCRLAWNARGQTSSPLKLGRMLATPHVLAFLCGVPLLWTANRNARDIQKGLELIRDRTPTAEPNLASHYLELVQWSSDGGAAGNDRFRLAFDGRRVDALTNPNLQYIFPTGSTTHHEIWWLEPVTFGSIDLLTEAANVERFQEHCSLSYFDGIAFRSVTDRHGSVAVRPFVPNTRESLAPDYRWLRYSLMAPIDARAIRITCRKLLTEIPLHEMEIR